MHEHVKETRQVLGAQQLPDESQAGSTRRSDQIKVITWIRVCTAEQAGSQQPEHSQAKRSSQNPKTANYVCEQRKHQCISNRKNKQSARAMYKAQTNTNLQ